MSVPTLATKITEETYPIAVACLAAGFASFPKSKVIGSYLIINELSWMTVNKEKRPYLVVKNSWMTKAMFQKNYCWVEKNNTLFNPVTKV